eukprot:656539-Pelagomonas_calceolata.AAC.1
MGTMEGNCQLQRIPAMEGYNFFEKFLQAHVLCLLSIESHNHGLWLQGRHLPACIADPERAVTRDEEGIIGLQGAVIDALQILTTSKY